MPKTSRFTETGLSKLEPASRRYAVFDRTLPAFGVRVEPSGTKAYQLSYRVNRRLRMATLGRVGVVTLDQARREARRMLGVVAQGRDPLRDRDASRTALTVRQAVSEWLEQHVAVRRKAGTLRNYRQAADRHIIPAFGGVPVHELRRADVAKLHGRLSATPYHANRVLAGLSAFCGWAEQRGYREPRTNPCLGIERYAEKGHKRYLSMAEYKLLGEAIREATRAHTLSPIALAAIELLLVTGGRPHEIATLKWDHVDLGSSALRLPDSKTGEKVMHLPKRGVELLEGWPRVAGSPYVFPGSGRCVKGAHIHASSLSHAWQKLRELANIDDARLYDAVRHSFASVGISTHGLSLAQVGEHLGHTQAGTTKRYAHLHDDVAKRNANAVGGTIAEALNGTRPDTGLVLERKGNA